jgi:hypothetical protein
LTILFVGTVTYNCRSGDPATITREVEVQNERALSADLWKQVRAELDARCEGEELGGLTPTEEEARQWRTARGDFIDGRLGGRRDEAANARWENLSVALPGLDGSATEAPSLRIVTLKPICK